MGQFFRGVLDRTKSPRPLSTGSLSSVRERSTEDSVSGHINLAHSILARPAAKAQIHGTSSTVYLPRPGALGGLSSEEAGHGDKLVLCDHSVPDCPRVPLYSIRRTYHDFPRVIDLPTKYGLVGVNIWQSANWLALSWLSGHLVWIECLFTVYCSVIYGVILIWIDFWVWRRGQYRLFLKVTITNHVPMAQSFTLHT